MINLFFIVIQLLDYTQIDYLEILVAWYHIVVAIDTTQATASNRVKIYVNGVQETYFATETYPAQNANSGCLVLLINT